MMIRRAVVLAALVVTAGPAAAQEYKAVPPLDLPLDKPGVWTLNFAYVPPRILTFDVPGQGKKQVWYMLYRVWNTSDSPHLLVPTFELVTKDLNTRHLDSPEPAIAKLIREKENPTGEARLFLHTSISISENKIPVTGPDSLPRAVYGVAIWPDVAEKAGKTNVFSVYVGGLSDGVAKAETDNGDEVISKKTLQLDFVRPTDDSRPGVTDIRPADNNGLGSEKWVYRPVSRKKAK